ncbi:MULTISPECIES: hypothetical protein [unclassified Curtobacterium]|uniref:hypothetical protein n=1 Tax=unclassified Curtobacterium TaxID=257496 RepID=UPI001FB393C3|nr:MULTISPECIES: hypothetical protein [unclassified Curtobacterium]
MIEPIAEDEDEDEDEDGDGDDELAVVLPAEHAVSSSDAAATAVRRVGRRVARCGMTGFRSTGCAANAAMFCHSTRRCGCPGGHGLA